MTRNKVTRFEFVIIKVFYFWLAVISMYSIKMEKVVDSHLWSVYVAFPEQDFFLTVIFNKYCIACHLPQYQFNPVSCLSECFCNTIH